MADFTGLRDMGAGSPLGWRAGRLRDRPSNSACWGKRMLSNPVVPYRGAAVILFCWAVVLAGCARSEDRVADKPARDTVTTAAAPAAPATISLAAVAGRWNIHVTD